MRLLSMTKMGKKIIDSHSSTSAANSDEKDELKVLEFLRDRNYQATEGELDFAVDGASYITRRMERKGLIAELTHKE